MKDLRVIPLCEPGSTVLGKLSIPYCVIHRCTPLADPDRRVQVIHIAATLAGESGGSNLDAIESLSGLDRTLLSFQRPGRSEGGASALRLAHPVPTKKKASRTRGHRYHSVANDGAYPLSPSRVVLGKAVKGGRPI